MKKQKLIIADILAIILSLIVIYLPLFTNKKPLINIYYPFMFAYFASIFSNKKDFKVILSFLPLISLSLIAIFMDDVDIYKVKSLLDTFYNFLVERYELILYLFIFYLVERIISKIFGAYFTKFLGIFLLIIFLISYNTKYLEIIDPIRLYFFYAFIYFSFARINPARISNKLLYVVAIMGLFIEILLIDKTKVFIGFYIFPLIITYLVLKGDIYEISFEKYFLNSLLYIFPFIKFLLIRFLKLTNLNLYMATSLITFFVSLIFYELGVGLFDYVFLGIHRKKRKR